MLLARPVRAQTLSYPRTIVFTLCNVNHVVLHDLYLLSKLVSRLRLEMTGGRLEHNRFHTKKIHSFVSRKSSFLRQHSFYYLIVMIPILPYHFLNSPVVQHEASPAFVADVIVQFSKQVMRPRVMLPLLAVIILLLSLIHI